MYSRPFLHTVYHRKNWVDIAPNLNKAVTGYRYVPSEELRARQTRNTHPFQYRRPQQDPHNTHPRSHETQTPRSGNHRRRNAPIKHKLVDQFENPPFDATARRGQRLTLLARVGGGGSEESGIDGFGDLCWTLGFLQFEPAEGLLEFDRLTLPPCAFVRYGFELCFGLVQFTFQSLRFVFRRPDLFGHSFKLLSCVSTDRINENSFPPPAVLRFSSLCDLSRPPVRLWPSFPCTPR